VAAPGAKAAFDAKFLGFSLDYCCICLRINQFASKADIFSAQILGVVTIPQAVSDGFSNEAIRLSREATVAWFLRFP
jgi:hypothetical protein